MKRVLLNIAVWLHIIKPFETYKGKRVTPFKAHRGVFFTAYKEIINKRSDLPKKKRDFIVVAVEMWLRENNINIKSFRDEL